MSEQVQISLKNIKADHLAQPRAEIDQGLVAEYTEAMKAGAEFPPVVVYQDGNLVHWLADGHHRYLASIEAGRKEIPAEVRRGGLRDAVLYSVGANATHGKRRTNEDKRRSVLKLLEDEEWSQWSDRKIAELAAVSNTFVSTLRHRPSVNGLQMGPSSPDSSPTEGVDPPVVQVRKVDRAGKMYSMNTRRIGTGKKMVCTVRVDPAHRQVQEEQARTESGEERAAQAEPPAGLDDSEAAYKAANDLQRAINDCGKAARALNLSILKKIQRLELLGMEVQRSLQHAADRIKKGVVKDEEAPETTPAGSPPPKTTTAEAEAPAEPSKGLVSTLPLDAAAVMECGR